MERHVKERLVGAAVLMAAAVILIPEMLSGPKREAETTAAAPADGPFKTYTIDLNRSPDAQPTTSIEESAPPPEIESSVEQSVANSRADDQQATSEAAGVTHQATPESAPVEPTSRPAPAVASRSPTPDSVDPPRPTPTQPVAPPPSRSIEKTQPAPIASNSSVPTSRGWAVQLGSFSNRATADRMVRDFALSGQNAFVMPVKSGANTLYRVRIGPFAQREAANDALASIKKRVANAAVVAHP